MTDVLFGQSYFLRFDPKLWEAMQPYPPLGTLYAASGVREAGFSVGVFDAMLADSTQEWANALDRYQPRYAVIYEDNFNYLSKMCLLNMRQAAFEMMTLGKARGCTLIVAGSDASDRYAEYLRAGADYVLIGEGEETLVELLGVLDGGDLAALRGIPGLARKDPSRDGQIVATPRRPVITDLDALPFAAWELVDVPKYEAIWRERHGYFSLNLVTTRGCPYHCNWCAKPIWGQRYNTRSPEHVVAEMKAVKQTFGPDHIWFADDIFGLKPGWLPRFAALVNAEEAVIPFKCLSRADLLLREGEIEALRQAGCRTVWIGAESGSQKILDAMDKGTKVEQIYQVSNRARAAGVEVGFFLQFGYPGETLADIEKTLQMVRDCQPDDIGISVSYPLPGTRFYAAVREQLDEKQNWIDSSDLDMLYAGPFSTAFYRHLHGVVHKEFRARKVWGQIKRLKPVSQRRLASMIYHWLSLPFARLKLHRLARVPHQGIGALPQVMRPEEAAQPSSQ